MVTKKNIHPDYYEYKKFIPEITSGLCVKVYDPDTITVVSELGGKKWLFSIRLLGIDAPEIKSKDIRCKNHAILGRDYLVHHILGKTIYLTTTKKDKYGRLLAEIFLNKDKKVSLNEMLIFEGFARKYDGGKKSGWDDFFESPLYKTMKFEIDE